ncbi:hypothetical protein [Lysobacter fragariae]
MPPNIADIVANQQQIRGELEQRKGVFKKMPERKRYEFEQKQTQLLTILDGKQNWDEDLSATEKTDAFNAMEWINAAVTEAEQDRVVCESRKKPGSNLTTRVCRSVREMDAARDNARQMIDDLGRCSGNGCQNGG